MRQLFQKSMQLFLQNKQRIFLFTILIIGTVALSLGIFLFVRKHFILPPKVNAKISSTPTIPISSTGTQTISPSDTQTSILLNQTGQGLLATHIDMNGGWAWKSIIQSPNLQTDRDVGASGIAMGFIALWQTTHNNQYLDAAKHAGDWLLSVAQTDKSGLKWPDYANSATDVSTDNFTSFDDGTMGIADLLWQLGSITGETKYTTAALSGVQWEMAQAQNVNGNQCPKVMCVWQWSNNNSSHQIGMGEGIAGIVSAFDQFSQRTGNSVYEEYATAGASYIASLMTPDGAIPETGDINGDGGTAFDTGFLSGNAGDAFMYLSLYKHTQNPSYLTYAKKVLTWVNNHSIKEKNGITWPLMLDPDAGDNTHHATGIEEGNAGIGWVELQAYALTKDPQYLFMASLAGDWLVSVAIPSQSGYAWNEYENPSANLTHTSLDNGAPGIGWFLYDLSLITKNQTYEQAAQMAVQYLKNTATVASNAAYWYENQTTVNATITHNLYQEPSWHWGGAGIAGFLARMNGWHIDMPGEESGL